MGCFTWTDAKKKPKLNKNGDYTRSSLIANGGYDEYAKVVCPNNTVLEEPYYYGYGIFAGHDIYELVVDWNRKYLQEIYSRLSENKNHFGMGLRQAAEMLANGIPEEEIQEWISEQINAKKLMPYLEKDWKRNIGIAIACHDEDNKALPYPIKITSNRKPVKYEELEISLNTQ